MEDQYNQAKELADDIEKQLNGQPGRHCGRRDGAWVQASVSILLAIMMSALGAIAFSIFGTNLRPRILRDRAEVIST